MCAHAYDTIDTHTCTCTVTALPHTAHSTWRERRRTGSWEMARRWWTLLALLAAAAAPRAGLALDNGLGLLPPMGWRNWWSWFGDVDQAKMEAAFGKMAERKRRATGRPGLTSFADLGYVRAGLDDAWQVTVDETVILLHPPLPLVGVSIATMRECQ